MDNVLSKIIDSYAKLKNLGIHVDASKIEERIKQHILEKLENMFPSISSEENVELSFNVRINSSIEPHINVRDVSLIINDINEPIVYVTEDDDNVVALEDVVSDSESDTEQVIASEIIKLSGSFRHKKSNDIFKNQEVSDKEEATLSQRDKDSTKYSLNGSEFLSKRVFAQRVVKTFMEQHPDYTYKQLKEIFNDDIIRPAWVCKGLLAKVDDLLDGTISKKQIDIRYNFKDTNLCLKSGDGVEFYVSTQWMRETIEKLILVAEKYGMHCEKSDNSLVNKANSYKSKHRNQNIKINYILVNGNRIANSNVTEMFVQFVKTIGAEKIYNLKIPINGGYLVDTKVIEKYKSSCKPIGQGLYLFTNRSTETKIKIMKDIANRLNLDVEINTDIQD